MSLHDDLHYSPAFDDHLENIHHNFHDDYIHSPIYEHMPCNIHYNSDQNINPVDFHSGMEGNEFYTSPIHSLHPANARHKWPERTYQSTQPKRPLYKINAHTPQHRTRYKVRLHNAAATGYGTDPAVIVIVAVLLISVFSGLGMLLTRYL